jgi:hypothetical protein
MFPVGSVRSVARGEIVGYADSTGNVTGPHLHFDLWNQRRLSLNAFYKVGWWAHDPEEWLGFHQEEDDMFTDDDRRVMQGMALFLSDPLMAHLRNITHNIINTDQKVNYFYGAGDNTLLYSNMKAVQDALRGAADGSADQNLRMALHAGADAMQPHIDVQLKAIQDEG